MNEQKILSDIIFETPDLVTSPYSWVKHIPFAFYLIDILKPKIFVELGVHTGNSFCAFCQAVKKLNIEAKCYGVDTWLGDSQAGLYENEIFDKLNEYIKDNYKAIAVLMKITFEEALGYFSDNSIDLLHIDGLHTYDAVKEDFQTWLPKMSDKGVVLIHDTEIREEGYGVWKFWQEISPAYLSFSFEHGCGLGVIVTGDKVDPVFIEFMHCINNNESYGNIFNRLGKLIYFENKEPVTKLFINCGEGFSEENSIASPCDISEEIINLTFDLSNYSKVESLRWDPLENRWCILKILSINYQNEQGNEYHLELEKISHNAIVEDDRNIIDIYKNFHQKGWLIFETIDPQILLPIQGKLANLKIQGKIEIIDQIHIDRQYREQKKTVSDLKEKFKDRGLTKNILKRIYTKAL